MDDTARRANRILLKFVTDKEGKLRYGAKLRQQMQEQLQRGETPSGYRVEWILATTTQLFGWIAERAAEFNAKHPQDAISLDDFSDVLATAQLQIKKKTKR